MKKHFCIFCCVAICISIFIAEQSKAKIQKIPRNYLLNLDECCDEECVFNICELAYGFADNICDIAVSIPENELCSEPEQRDCIISANYGVSGCYPECDGETLTASCLDQLPSEGNKCESMGFKLNSVCEIPAKFRKEEEDGEAGFCG